MDKKDMSGVRAKLEALHRRKKRGKSYQGAPRDDMTSGKKSHARK